MSSDHRKLKRRQLIYYLTVVERDTDKTVGYLVDITTKGLMIMSDNPVESGVVFHLKVLLDTAMTARDFLELEVKSLWSKKSVNGESYDTGFAILYASPDTLMEIENIIDELAFSN